MKPTSKAAMIAEKDRAIVLAARQHFLRDGFAGASMDGIAKSAGVSVKTIYSHFASKEELFSKVIIVACTDHLLSDELPSNDVLAQRFAWFRKANQRGLMEAGREYLRHLLSEEQLALYRIVTCEANRFPELGRQYQKNIARAGQASLLHTSGALLERKPGPRETQDKMLSPMKACCVLESLRRPCTDY